MLMKIILVLTVLQLLVSNHSAAELSKRCEQILANEIDDVDEFEINDCLHVNGTYEGDMRLTDEQMEQLMEAISEEGLISREVHEKMIDHVESHNRRVKRGASSRNSRWNMHRDEEGNVIIPFVYEDTVKKVREYIEEAIEEFNKKTCIRFVPRTDQEPYIRIGNYAGCSSLVGRVKSKGSQKLSLTKNCKKYTIVLHEIMHTLGFWHEQSRPDRDDYVTVFYENIKPERRGAFKKFEPYDVNSFNSPFDKDSIMMYGSFTYAINKTKGPSMVDKKTGLPIVKTMDFDKEDIHQINAMYKCDVKEKYCNAPQLTEGARYGSSSGHLLKERDHGRTFDHGEWLNISSCPEGTAPGQVTKITCLDGTFQPEALLCLKKCFPPKVNGEGHIKEWGRNTFAFGEKVSVVCGHLHSAVGPTEATCGESGFDVTEFTCVDDYPGCKNKKKSCDVDAMTTDRCMNSSFKTKKCRRSCGCDEGPVVCKDIKSKEHCQKMAESNKCETEYKKMFKDCKDSCGFCIE